MHTQTHDKTIRRLRYELVALSHRTRTPHLGSALSCLDILLVIYRDLLREKDHCILSKGHAAAALYVVLAEEEIIPKAWLDKFGQPGSPLTEHPSPRGVPGVRVATGSLGHGLSIAAGMALGAKMRGHHQHLYVVLSDGECNEGSVWEAALFAAAQKLDNLTVIIDFNKWQATGRSQEVLAIDPLADKWRAFGWSVREGDGHDPTVLQKQLLRTSEKPKCLIAHTVKGKGVPWMEDDNNWHYRIPTEEEVAQCAIDLQLT